MSRRAMFSSRLERRRQVRRFALIVGATVFAIGMALVALIAVRGFDFLGVAEADRLPLGVAVLGGVGAVFVLAFLAYASVRMFSRIE